MVNKMNKEERIQYNYNKFIEKAIIIHNNFYNYDEVKYVNSKTKIKVLCPIHGLFEITPNDHINSKAGCKQCGIIKQKNTIQNKYGVPNISKLESIKQKKKETFKANFGVEHQFERINMSELAQQRFGVDNFSKAQEIKHQKIETNLKNNNVTNPNYLKWTDHQFNSLNSVQWLKHEYVDLHKSAVHIAKELGVSDLTVGRYLKRYGIDIHHTHGFSKGCIMWLEDIMAEDGIHIQHAKNGGEFRIPGTRYKVDGYCQETNTIYEFYGDIYHGNPNIFKSDEVCNPYLKLTAGELYDRTMIREQILMDMGYNVISKWENNQQLINKRLNNETH